MHRDSPQTSHLGDLCTLVLGQDPKLRARVSMTLIAVYGYAVCSGLLVYLLTTDLVVSRLGALWLLAYMWTGVPIFYLLVRTGVSSKLGSPGLDLAQCLFAMSAIVASYYILGSVRNGVLLLIALVIMFSMITLTPRQVRIMSALTIVSLGGVMVLLALTSAREVDAREEIIKFVLAACTLPALSAVASHVAKLRTKLVEQKSELRTALALLQEIATHDELTGLYNRRHMLQLMTQQINRQLRNGEGFCLALIDLDNFKQVNDRHGHQMGDLVLKSFADTIKTELRQTDVLARWGGEEFLLMLTAPDPGLLGAQASMARFQAALANTEVGPGIRVTFSAGLTEHLLGELLHETLERADRGLYAAKEQGRDRMVLVWA